MLKKYILLSLIALTTYSIDIKTGENENRDPIKLCFCTKIGCLGPLPGQRSHHKIRDTDVDFTMLQHKQQILNSWKYYYLPIAPDSN
jgi:hypothetical protein